MPPVRNHPQASPQLPQPAAATTSPGKAKKPYAILDGGQKGERYRKVYEDAIVPEFSRQPDPSIERPTNPRPPPITLADLQCVKTLGNGESGRVLLVRTKRKSHPLDMPGTLFALKVVKRMDYRNVMDEHFLETQRERSALVDLPWSPFVSGFVRAFSDERNLYMMLELIPSGTLRSMISSRGPLDASSCAFYFANIVCALEFLRSHRIIHGDIKPDNILVGEDGYICLTDFGSAAYVTEKSGWGYRGTPTYQAPECIINPLLYSGKHGAPIDWWAAGCVLYEMRVGKLPFYASSLPKTRSRILNAEYKWPNNISFSKQFKEIVARLLTVNPTKRLGRKIREVEDHPWLRNINWSKMVEKQYLAPWVPKAQNLTESWHKHPIPQQRKVPGLEIVEPPIRFAHDNRFPEKRSV